MASKHIGCIRACYGYATALSGFNLRVPGLVTTSIGARPFYISIYKVGVKFNEIDQPTRWANPQP